MYKLNTPLNMNNAPWEISFTARVRKLNTYISEGFDINIIVYEYPDTSTFRYRGYNIFQIMEESNSWRVIYFFQHELDKIVAFLSKISVVTISRMRWSFQLQKFIETVKKWNVPIAFDVDDRVFDLDYLPIVTNTLNASMSSDNEYDFWFAYISRIGFTASKADAYITTNQFLANALETKFKKHCSIIPNFLNKEQISVSEKCIIQKSKQKSRKPFTIGYFSGTPSHINDFKIVYKQILQLLIDYDDINLCVVGFMEFPEEMHDFIKKGRIKFTGLVDFLTLQQMVAAVDVNIVPLVINDFTNCKSELKYFEAAIVNTITCASPIYTYANSIIDGENGFLCRQSEWYDKIKAIYMKTIDEKKIAKNAYLHTMNNYQGEKIIAQIEKCLNDIKLSAV